MAHRKLNSSAGSNSIKYDRINRSKKDRVHDKIWWMSKIMFGSNIQIRKSAGIAHIKKQSALELLSKPTECRSITNDSIRKAVG